MRPNDTVRLCQTCRGSFTPKNSSDPGLFCSRDCYFAHRRAVAIATREARFWSYVDHNDPSGCWIWKRSKRGEGYGQFCVGHNRAGYAHRFAWEFATGETLTKDDKIGHVCDNPPCVRNDEMGFYEVDGILLPRRGHLFKGTDADNVADMIAKGRVSLVGRLNPIGVRNPKARLSDDIVREIRRRADEGISAYRLAPEYGISHSTAVRIVSRKLWRHVT